MIQLYEIYRPARTEDCLFAALSGPDRSGFIARESLGPGNEADRAEDGGVLSDQTVTSAEDAIGHHSRYMRNFPYTNKL